MALLEWYLEDLARFKREREELIALAARVEWLSFKAPRTDDQMRVLVDFDIDIGHRQFPLVLRYPRSFPHSPPSVLPRDSKERWSAHQFGAGGELCLEFRPDNWLPEIMGWQMVESAYRLLSGENPAPNAHGEVVSAHATSEGQRLRGATNRLLLTHEMTDLFRVIEVGEHAHGEATASTHALNIVYCISALKGGDETLKIPSFPAVLTEEGFVRTVHITRVAPGAALPDTTSKEAFGASAAPYGWQPQDGLFVVLQQHYISAYRVFDTWVQELGVVLPGTMVTRLPANYQALSTKRVGIVGCGSLGSKIATMLARAGVDAFVLVDDDLMLPGNIVRHDLDWRDVGLHKATAVSERLQRIRATIVVRIWRQQLGGQESASSAESALSSLASCDLIVDATANPIVSNILSGLVASSAIPVMWAEVFGGGIGGLIARYRPGREPSIPLMRFAIENWFADRGTPPLRAEHNYEQQIDDVTFVADDADVTAIAAPAARLAIDTLLAREPSHFPRSVYVIGLAPCVLFEQPFVTFPLELPDSPMEDAPPPLSEAEQREALEQVQAMLTTRSES
jgi:molybdopterin/thiamine biosynthesis adenylyltransferase